MVKNLNLLSKKEKEEWLSTIEIVEEDQLQEIQGFFENFDKNEDDFLTELIVRSGLEKEYKQGVKKLAQNAVLKAKNKNKKKK